MCPVVAWLPLMFKIPLKHMVILVSVSCTWAPVTILMSTILQFLIFKSSLGEVLGFELIQVALVPKYLLFSIEHFVLRVETGKSIFSTYIAGISKLFLHSIYSYLHIILSNLTRQTSQIANHKSLFFFFLEICNENFH